MKRKTNNIKNVTNDKITKYLSNFVMLIVILAAFFPPFFRGLYFGNELYPTEVIVFCGYLAFLLVKLYKHDKLCITSPLDYVSIAFVLVYALSLINAVSTHTAIDEWLKYCMYFAVFSMVSYVARDINKQYYILWTIVCSAVAVSLIGIDAAAGGTFNNLLMGWLKNFGMDYLLKDTMQYARISSTLQYANALAAYLMAVFFLLMPLLLHSQKLLTKALIGSIGFILLTVFLLTQSRGSYLVLPAAFIVFLLLHPRNDAVPSIINFAGFGLVAGAATLLITQYISDPKTYGSRIWLVILTGCVLSGLLFTIIDRVSVIFRKLSRKVYISILLVLVVIATAGGAFLLNAKEPLELSHSEAQPESTILVRRSTVLEPNRSYKLEYDVNAVDNGKPYAYQVRISSRNEKNILFDEWDIIENSYEKGTNGEEAREISFSTPSDSMIICIDFINYHQNTRAVFNTAKIIDVTDSKVEKTLVLKYRYLPDEIMSRLEGTMKDKSALQRGYFVKDGLKIFRDYWLTGAGGGAWEKLYSSYQTVLYNTTQTHNYYLQVIIETGILGFILLICLGIVVLQMIFRFKRQAVTDENQHMHIMQAALASGMIALLTHSAMDFDLSLSAVALLLWILAGIFNCNYIFMIPIDKQIKLKKINLHTFPAITITVILIILPLMFGMALYNGTKGSRAVKNQDLETGLEHMQAAESLNPWMPQYKIDTANLIYALKYSNPADRAVADNMMLEAEKLAQYESKLLPNIGAYYLKTARIDEGLSLYERFVSLVPLVPEAWEQKVGVNYSVLLKYAEAGKQDKTIEYMNKILGMSEEAKRVNENNINPFVFTAKTMEVIERVRYLKDYSVQSKQINLDKVLLFETKELDINFDGIPDGWKINNDFVQFRKLYLMSGKKYKIEVTLSNTSMLEAVRYKLDGVLENGELKYNNGVYYGEVEIPPSFKPENNTISIYLRNTDAIEKVIMIEL